ncbi:hypothetical protein ACQKWADRAFT_314398 [Trichoderma austrokoningii]
MSGQRLVMVALIGAGVIGAKMFLPRKSNPQERGDIEPETRDLSDKDPRYREVDTGGSKQNLPAGGVSSGRGGGGTTVSASEKLGFGGYILGNFGKKTLSRSDQEGYHDTRGISRMGSEIPSKKHADVRE